MGMVFINLLPAEARKGGGGSAAFSQLLRIPLVWMAGILMLTFPVLLLVPLRLANQQLQQLQATLHTLAPKQAEVTTLQQALQQLNAQETALSGLRAHQERWSGRLNVLSNVTPDGVWFRELSMERAKDMVVQGSAIARGGGEMVDVGRLVQALKASSEFSGAVRDLQIESIKRIQDGEIELVEFNLTGTLVNH